MIIVLKVDMKWDSRLGHSFLYTVKEEKKYGKIVPTVIPRISETPYWYKQLAKPSTLPIPQKNPSS